LRIWFRAPQFDAGGAIVRHARVMRVILNDVPIQENVDVSGPTIAHMKIPEAPTNPIMLQGTHGPIAFRNIYIKPFEVGRE
jgi:Domain of Unknown Function (DUF1080)